MGRPSDIPGLYRIFEESFQDELSRLFRTKYPASFFRRAFSSMIPHTLVADMNSEVVGFVSCLGSSKRELIRTALALLFPFIFVLLSARPSLLKYVHGRFTRVHDLSRAPGIACIAVETDFRGKGVGTMLLKATLEHFRGREIRLSVRSWRKDAHHLYLKMGFTECGRWEDALGTWIEMRRSA